MSREMQLAIALGGVAIYGLVWLPAGVNPPWYRAAVMVLLAGQVFNSVSELWRIRRMR